jgi:hypothetical protein
MGRSHLVIWRSRFRELLSDGELDIQNFIVMTRGVEDSLEQFPLSLDSSPHELSRWDLVESSKHYAGTREIAKQLNIRHPKCYGGGESCDWVMSTDFLVLLRDTSGRRRLLAISKKPDDLSHLSKRTRQLFQIEKAYWCTRGVIWILITPAVYREDVADTLRRSAPWIYNEPAGESALERVSILVHRYASHSFQYTLGQAAREFGDLEIAQCALWQAIWTGRIPVDLRRGWRPHIPLDLMDQHNFHALNPVASGRSAWTS